MKKMVYTTPSVEISKWENKDIITTSGLQVSESSLNTANIGSTGYATASISYNNIKE